MNFFYLSFCHAFDFPKSERTFYLIFLSIVFFGRRVKARIRGSCTWSGGSCKGTFFRLLAVMKSSILATWWWKTLVVNRCGKTQNFSCKYLSWQWNCLPDRKLSMKSIASLAYLTGDCSLVFDWISPHVTFNFVYFFVLAINDTSSDIFRHFV